MTHTTVDLFVGPTGHRLPESLLHQAGVRLHPPARRGSMARLIESRPPAAIALVDGRYDDVPAVGHRELLDAVGTGWQVTGLGSIGALRAAELHPLGMTGYGRVFEYLLATGGPDDEVALLHGPAPDYRPLSEALVDLRAFAHYLAQAGVLEDAEATAVIEDLALRWFGDRTVPTFLDTVSAVAGSAAGSAAHAHLHRLPEIRIKSGDLRDYLTERSWTRPPTPARSSPPTAEAGPSSTPATTRSA